ncbi:hypothetical protein DL546_004096 [Coniochaeta pulveracea]|uniref:CENP-V/GFA domain-containing protein n=1 Tax=Coniochaeta pulveracea TaxID=177199 RepID=A0A420YB48_9PEZI|nr:hypothetical protein DL546_004096 [Coniochaeta pulveracea]
MSSSDALPPSSSSPAKLTGSCHCGRVTLELPSKPTKINECRCSICYRYGALWAYYPRNEVLVTAKEPGLKSYLRDDPECSKDIGFYLCGHCGCLTHWWGLEGAGRGGESAKMGVNTRILGEKGIEGVERHIGYK